MLGSKIGVDELLAAQEQTSLLATVEPVEDDPQAVTVTPWSPDGGCTCGAAIRVPKSAIESVTLTGDAHLCCGKVLRVVGLSFRSGAQIPLADLFEQMATAARTAGALGPDPTTEDMSGECLQRFDRCSRVAQINARAKCYGLAIKACK